MRLLTLIVYAAIATVFPADLIAKEPAVILDIEMVDVKGGTFIMGLDENEAEHLFETPKHEVALTDFRIARYEVTQELWEAVMGDNPSISKGENLPVENVSWHDIQTFIKKLNKLTGKKYRLPTEAEWEFAARGGNLSEGYYFIGGNENEIDKTAWHCHNSDKHAHQIGLLNPNELGIYDMGGNVSEWVSDWFGHYSEKAQKNPKGAKKSDIGKIFRGGSFSTLPEYNKPGCRFVSNPNFKCSYIGFRLAE